MKKTFSCLFVLTLLELTTLYAQVFRYDFGALEVADCQQVRAKDDAGNLTWDAAPASEFTHEQYGAWRSPTWMDGVTGDRLAWQLEVPDGKYELQLFLNAGLELTSTWQIAINRIRQEQTLHPVRNNPEPPEEVVPQVKIWRTPVEVTDGQLSIELEGGQDSIRLLAANLLAFPLRKVPGDRQNWILGMAEAYGKMSHAPKPLEPLVDILRFESRNQPDEAWIYKLLLEAEWLHLTETFLEMRGWQWSTNLYDLSMIGKFQQGVMLLDPITQQSMHPLYERALWLKARLMYHLDHEYDHEADRMAAQRDFALLLERYPQDTLLRMYQGVYFRNSFPEPDLVDQAPEWSKAQAVGLHRLRQLVHYWVVERQAPNGEMGGKYGDDVEALRFWYPLFYTGDSLAILGLRRLADGVWYSKKVRNGFARQISDVEHASEFISDTAPLLIAASDDEALHRRALPTAHLMDSLWTGKDSDGRLFFKSSWYSSSGIDERPPRNRDVPMNTRTTKVLRYWLWRNPEHDFVRNLLTNWSRSWLSLAKDESKGKPVGLFPASYRLSDGAVNGDEPNWYQANMYWPYYDFRGDAMMLDQLLFLWQYEQKKELLFPLERTLAMVDQYRNADGPAGSAAWAAAHFMKRADFWALAGQWRLLTGLSDYDDLLSEYGSSYLKFRLHKDEAPLLKSLREFNDQIGYNWARQTKDTWFTDRIYAAGPGQRGRVSSNILKATLTGDMNDNGTSPYMAVTWDQIQPGFTALVEDHSNRHLEVSLFNHAKTTQKVTMRMWALKKGVYQVNLNGKFSKTVRVEEAGQRLAIDLPSGLLVKVEISR